MPNEQLSSTMRDYLVKIYRLSEQNTDAHYVGTSELADLLMVSAPAVNRMVTKLRELGLLHHERYQGLALTEAGQREALKHLRRHRLIETFLVDVMGMSWHEVHDEAERMSGALGDKILDRMAEMTHNPSRDPHGEPIPTAEGTVVMPNDVLLTEAPLEREYTISRITTDETSRLEYMAALGLMPDATFKLLHAAPFNGPLQLQLGREYRIIGYNLAQHIRVFAPSDD